MSRTEEEALAILREFVADCMILGHNDPTETYDHLRMVQDWPDLAETFKRAFALLVRAD